MYLQKTSNKPSVQINNRWSKLTPLNPNNLNPFIYKSDSVSLEVYHKKIITQRDKLIFEFALHQSQLQKREKLQINLNDIIDGLGIKRTTQNRNNIIESFLKFKDNSITVVQKNHLQPPQTMKLDFDVEILDGKKQGRGNERIVVIDFTQFNIFFDGTTKLKKYLLNLKSEEMLWMYDFFRIKVQQRNSKRDGIHKQQFRYRGFKQKDILEWFNLQDEYHNSRLTEDEKGIEKINHYITNLLRLMRKYADLNDLSFPTYRLIDKMYKVKEYNYKNEISEIEQIKEILKIDQNDYQKNSKSNSIE